jgi:hypothetical protein
MAVTVRPPIASRIGLGVVRGVDDEHLVVVADQPDVVVDVEVGPVEAEDAETTVLSIRAVTCRTPPRTRSTSPWCIFSKAASTSYEADGLRDEVLEREAALPVEATSIGKSREGRQSPYQLDLNAPPRPKHLDQREGDGHVRRRDADQHDAAARSRA